MNQDRITRRAFVTRAAGLTLTLGAGCYRQPAFGADRSGPYASGLWMAGNHHIHTKYSYDGMYDVAEQVAASARCGLAWCVITDHGDKHHDRTVLTQAYPDLVDARRKHPEILVFLGLEWNSPAGDHCSVIMPPTRDEARIIADFEAAYDGKNISRHEKPPNEESDTVQGIQYLQKILPRPLFIANHVSRYGYDSPHEFRDWSDAGPDVVRGFEAGPGHQAAQLNSPAGVARGEYSHGTNPKAFAGYPPEAYRTYGGYDWCVATVGGVWDSLLGEGRPWYITINGDSHRHWDDRRIVDESQFQTRGYCTVTNRLMTRTEYEDFYPGEYSKTWVFGQSKSHAGVLDAMRSGSMFAVHGDLIDRLELTARSGDRVAPMGATLRLDRAGEDVTLTVKMRVPKAPNRGGSVPRLHHIDVIAGSITGPAADRDAMTNPTAHIVAQVPGSDLKREGDMLVYRHRFPNVKESFYVRVRGTNTNVGAPSPDPPLVNPWSDLWFYSNPVMIRVAA